MIVKTEDMLLIMALIVAILTMQQIKLKSITRNEALFYRGTKILIDLSMNNMKGTTLMRKKLWKSKI